MTYWTYYKKAEMPEFTEFGGLQSSHGGILEIISAFWWLERYSEENNGVTEPGTAFLLLECCSGIWNVTGKAGAVF